MPASSPWSSHSSWPSAAAQLISTSSVEKMQVPRVKPAQVASSGHGTGAMEQSPPLGVEFPAAITGMLALLRSARPLTESQIYAPKLLLNPTVAAT